MIAKIKKAVEQAKEDGKSKWEVKIPANLKLPLRDGDLDRPEDEAYAGAYFINANSKQAPQVVDRNVQPILDQSELYSGCYIRASVTFTHITVTEIKELRQDSEIFRKFVMESHLVPE